MVQSLKSNDDFAIYATKSETNGLLRQANGRLYGLY